MLYFIAVFMVPVHVMEFFIVKRSGPKTKQVHNGVYTYQ